MSLCNLLQMSSTQLVQYVVVRGDLLRLLSWSTGAVIAQACHASTAAIWSHRDDPNTITYTNELDHMHKVVLEVRTNMLSFKEVFFFTLNSGPNPQKLAKGVRTPQYPSPLTTSFPFSNEVEVDLSKACGDVWACHQKL